MFIIVCWKPDALGYGNIVYFVMRQTWLSFLSYCYCKQESLNKWPWSFPPLPPIVMLLSLVVENDVKL